jgi:hypothetical protein
MERTTRNPQQNNSNGAGGRGGEKKWQKILNKKVKRLKAKGWNEVEKVGKRK